MHLQQIAAQTVCSTFAKTNKTAENQPKSNAKKQKMKETLKKITRVVSELIDSVSRPCIEQII